MKNTQFTLDISSRKPVLNYAIDYGKLQTGKKRIWADSFDAHMVRKDVHLYQHREELRLGEDNHVPSTETG